MKLAITLGLLLAACLVALAYVPAFAANACSSLGISDDEGSFGVMICNRRGGAPAAGCSLALFAQPCSSQYVPVVL